MLCVGHEKRGLSAPFVTFCGWCHRKFLNRLGNSEIATSTTDEHHPTRQDVLSRDGLILILDFDVVEVRATIGDGAAGLSPASAQSGAYKEVDDGGDPDLELPFGEFCHGIS